MIRLAWRLAVNGFYDAFGKNFFGVVIFSSFIFASYAQAAPKIEHWHSKDASAVYLISSAALPIVDVNISFAAGNAYASADKAGLAEIVNQLLENGSGDFNEQQIADKLADIGAILSLSTDWDRSNIQLRVLKSEMSQGFDLLAKIVSQPRFEAEIFQRQLVINQQSLKESLTRPDFIAQRTFWQNLYPTNHPYSRLKTTASLANIGLDDVRQFYGEYYSRKNMVISLVGDIDKAQAEQLVEQISAKLPTGEKKVLSDVAIDKSKKIIQVAHPTSQAHILIGTSGFARGSSDFFPFLVANYTLGGGGFVSRLMNEVREKRGFAYSVGSNFQPLRLTGTFNINLQTKLDNRQKAIEVSEATMRDFIVSGPTSSELAAAKSYLISSFPLNLDSNAKLIGTLATIAFYQLPLTWLDEYQAKVAAVTTEQIKQTLNKIIKSDSLITIIVGGAE